MHELLTDTAADPNEWKQTQMSPDVPNIAVLCLRSKVIFSEHFHAGWHAETENITEKRVISS